MPPLHRPGTGPLELLHLWRDSRLVLNYARGAGHRFVWPARPNSADAVIFVTWPIPAPPVRPAILSSDNSGRAPWHDEVTDYARVITPSHVHAVFQPKAALPSTMRWLMGRTGQVVNRVLDRTATPLPG